MNVRIASAAYAVPPDGEAVKAVLERERDRVQATLAPLSPQARQKAAEGLGLSRVRVCGAQQPYDLVREAAATAITDAGITGPDINLILDYSTFPGENSQSLSLAHKLSADLGAETSMNLSFKAGGCGALHLAIKTALGWMSTDKSIQTALLVTGDTAPRGQSLAAAGYRARRRRKRRHPAPRRSESHGRPVAAGRRSHDARPSARCHCLNQDRTATSRFRSMLCAWKMK